MLKNILNNIFIESDVCSSGWANFSTSCYKLTIISITQIKAEQNCENSGALLVSVDDQEEWDFLVKFVNRTSMTFWVYMFYFE